jgi:signal transduction histidine kinase
MSVVPQRVAPGSDLTQRERELGGIIDAYNHVTEQLKQSHEKLRHEVARLREELAQKNRQLRRRERLAALGEMAAGVAHEIRNPLGGIQLFASLLEKDLRDRPPERRLATRIAKGVAAVEAIVTDFLEFGRPRDPQPRTVRIEVIVREVMELASGRIEGEVRIEVSDALREIEMVSDGAMIKRALLNLVLNALDAARQGKDPSHEPRVVIGGRHQSENVVLTVADNGPGVPAELMDRIFNPFFTTKDKGTGLGLAIVHQIAESLGGNVQVVNAPGGGAVFTLSIPARLAADAEDE